MNVEDVFTALSFGELSRQKIGKDATGGIASDQHDQLTSLLQRALKTLYTRYSHKKDYVKLEQVEGVTEYHLRSEFTVSNTDVDNDNPRYIIDTEARPFSGDIIKIVSVRDEDAEPEDQRLRINDQTSPNGIQLMSYDTLYIKNPTAGNVLTVEVQVNHHRLSIPTVLTETVAIAPALENALLFRMAQLYFMGMGGEDASFRARSLGASYEQECSIAELQGNLPTHMTTDHNRFSNQGFV
jgi:hypothetical protein